MQAIIRTGRSDFWRERHCSERRRKRGKCGLSAAFFVEFSDHILVVLAGNAIVRDHNPIDGNELVDELGIEANAFQSHDHGLHHVTKADWNESFRNCVPKHVFAR
jgi:hypothetical protein